MADGKSLDVWDGGLAGPRGTDVVAGGYVVGNVERVRKRVARGSVHNSWICVRVHNSWILVLRGML
jgi:hypothetical protein